MGKGKRKDVVYEESETNTVIDEETGEVKQTTVTNRKKVRMANDEPRFIKLYVDAYMVSKELSKGLSPIALAFAKRMSFAEPIDPEDENSNGGQVIYINMALKKRIAQELGIGINRINQALSEFNKAGVFKRVDTGAYQVNPALYGLGDWADIKALKATFEYSENGFAAGEPEIVTN